MGYLIVKRRIVRMGITLLTWPLRLIKSWEAEVKRQSCIADDTARFLPGSSVVNRGAREQIRVGPHSWIHGQLSIFRSSGVISIGSYSYVGEGSRIWCAADVTIGDRVQIAHNVNIHDHNAHPISASRRHLQVLGIYDGRLDMDDVRSSPIVIKDDVWIGFNATILKGVTIGEGAVIGAETVISKDVPPYAIMVGSPPRQIGTAPQ